MEMIHFSLHSPCTAEDLMEIVTLLRDPINGCPWDSVQTHQSIRKNFLEETCEVLEAIDTGDPVLLREELGDVLMQVALHTCMEQEKGAFTFSDVCEEVCRKLIYRHPHIFSSDAPSDAGLNSWDALKNKEKGRMTLADELNTVPATLPALMKAQKLQKRAEGYGCGAVTQQAAAEQLECSYAALKQALSPETGKPLPETEQIAGDFLFDAANALRLAGVDAEQALEYAAAAFKTKQVNG